MTERGTTGRREAIRRRQQERARVIEAEGVGIAGTFYYEAENDAREALDGWEKAEKETADARGERDAYMKSYEEARAYAKALNEGFEPESIERAEQAEAELTRLREALARVASLAAQSGVSATCAARGEAMDDKRIERGEVRSGTNVAPTVNVEPEDAPASQHPGCSGSTGAQP